MLNLSSFDRENSENLFAKNRLCLPKKQKLCFMWGSNKHKWDNATDPHWLMAEWTKGIHLWSLWQNSYFLTGKIRNLFFYRNYCQILLLYMINADGNNTCYAKSVLSQKQAKWLFTIGTKFERWNIVLLDVRGKNRG